MLKSNARIFANDAQLPSSQLGTVTIVAVSATASPRRHPGEDWIRQAHVDLVGLWEAAPLRVYEAYDVAVGPRWRIELNPQPYTEIWLVTAGICAVELGAQQGLAQAGDVVVLRPGQRRSSANPGPDELRLTGFGCSLTALDGADLLGKLEWPLIIRSVPAEIAAAVERVVGKSHGSSAERIFGARAEAAGTLAALATLIGTQFESSPETLRPGVAAALQFIAERFHERLDVPTIAAAAHLSPQHLTRCFREALGVGPMGYVRSYRLNRARELLITTNQPVSQVMSRVGYSDLAHFSNAFKIQFGLSPRALQRLSRDQ
jgi:AraC-like DNA-binding protein